MRHRHTEDRYELLCTAARGSVFYCPDCGGMQLRFGNAVLGLAQDDVPIFRQSITIEKDTTLFVGDTGVGFTFNAYEIRMINHLLDDAERILLRREHSWNPSAEPLTFVRQPLNPHAH